MNVLVDTSVWSSVLRRSESKNTLIEKALSQLVDELRVKMIGPIRQELLSGIKTTEQFEYLRERLTSFPDLPLITSDYEKAAEFYKICRSKGVQGSNTDYLIAATAFRHGLEIFTLDQDFTKYKKYLPISLYSPH